MKFAYAIRQEQLTHTLVPLDECDKDPARDRGSENTALVRSMHNLLMSQEHGDLEITNVEEGASVAGHCDSLDEEHFSMGDKGV